MKHREVYNILGTNKKENENTKDVSRIIKFMGSLKFMASMQSVSLTILPKESRKLNA